MKSLFEKTKQTHTTMMQKVKDALHHRDDMRIQMEEAFTTKEAVSTGTDLLIVNATLYMFCQCYSNPCSSALTAGSKIIVYFVFIKPVSKKNRAVLC